MMIEVESVTVNTPPSAPQASPIRRRPATLFVDIAGSTSLLIHHPPEVVLGVVQGFMTLVTEIASAHAGTVRDFEGDGALVYFASVKNAVRAALTIRRKLADGRGDVACGDGRGIALIGPRVNIGARLLKHAPSGAIIASGEVLAELRQRDATELVDEFHAHDATHTTPPSSCRAPTA